MEASPRQAIDMATSQVELMLQCARRHAAFKHDTGLCAALCAAPSILTNYNDPARGACPHLQRARLRMQAARPCSTRDTVTRLQLWVYCSMAYQIDRTTLLPKHDR